MRSMLQLLGGVAAAGVVAASSTAFTASGLTSGLSSTSAIGGGKASITVDGATVESVVLVSGNAGAADQITGAKLTLAGTNGATLDNANSVVALDIKGTDNLSNAATTRSIASCTWGSSVWTCNIGTPATNYLTSVTDIYVSVTSAAVS